MTERRQCQMWSPNNPAASKQIKTGHMCFQWAHGDGEVVQVASAVAGLIKRLERRWCKQRTSLWGLFKKRQLAQNPAPQCACSK